VYGFEITDPAVPDDDKQHLVIISRQHQYEAIGSHVGRGLTTFLI